MSRYSAGERHNRLTSVGFVGERKGQPRWIFRCDCGTEKEMAFGAVRAGAIRSCGCLIGEANRKRLLKHGYQGSPIYISWQGAKGRCLNPKNKSYPNYGGRGITICDRWKDSFEAFLEDIGEQPAGLSLDRIDVNGNYEPGNCRWATQSQQMVNLRSSRRINHEGETYSIPEFASLMSVNLANLYYRLRAGHDPMRAVEALRAGKWRRIA
jgi:hypothetical protein